MSKRALLTSAMGITLLARQYGVRVQPDAVEDAISKGTIRSRRDLESYFSRQGIQATLRKLRSTDLVDKKYLFPCVGLMKDNRALILVGVQQTGDASEPVITTFDPTDPSAATTHVPLKEFKRDWSGRAVLVAKASGESSRDRPFDWKWFLPELARYKGLLLTTFIASVLMNGLAITPIIYIQIALDKVLAYEAQSTLYVLTLGVVVALLFSGLLTYGRDYVIGHISTVIESRISGDIFDKLLELPAQTFQTTGHNELETQVMSVVAVRNFISRQLLTTIYEATGILVFTPILFGYSPILAALVLGFALLQGATDLISKSRQKTVGESTGIANAKRDVVLRETLANIDAVKTLSQELPQRREWRATAARAIVGNLRLVNSTNLASSVNTTVGSLMTVAIVFVGINLVFAGALSAGAIISCNMLGARVLGPIRKLITFRHDSRAFFSAVDNITNIWNAPPERSGHGAQRILQGQFTLRNVDVRFGDSMALHGVSLTVPARQRIALVGSSASGKTTLLRLLQGLLKPNGGYIEVDGVNAASLDIAHYRSQIALVDGSPRFFSGTIEENIRRVRPNISEREFELALEHSGLARILPDLSAGLSTEVDQAGSNLSRSHKVIVGLARALATRPNLLLLDDCFSNLDTDCQVHLYRHLNEISKGRTLIATLHDMRLVKAFDRIMVLESGKAVGVGTHAALIADCPPYQNLWTLEEEIGTAGRMMVVAT